ncbi:recombinase family protein [Vreelandella aquamarina]|uniref:recombinase family protein n=1 Tax=Vreelandella aquamarina TaxID=77097 RepID=UPI00384F6CB7
MTIAVAYVRYSTAVQSEGDSVDRQTTPLEAFEKKFGVKVRDIYIDEGVSSYKGENIKKGKFKEILDEIDNQVISSGDYLVIESIDRVSRQALSKTTSILYGILDKGINIYTTSDEHLYSIEDYSKDFENYLMMGLIAKRANEESETKSKRRKSAWNKAKRLAEDEGKVFTSSNNVPYGLTVTEDGRLEIVDEEADEIRAIFESLKYVGVLKTIREVNKWSKRKWASKHIAYMLKSKYPIGVYRASRRENGKKVFEHNIENYYPKIVDEDVFYNAVSAMQDRKRKTHYGNESVGSLNIFKHCVKCAECGETMSFTRGKNPSGNQYAYFRCSRKKETATGCEEQSFRFDYAVGTLLIYLKIMFEKHLREQEFKMSSASVSIDLPETYFSKEAIEKQKFANASSMLMLEMTRKKDGEANKQQEAIRIELVKEKSMLRDLEDSAKKYGGKLPHFVIRSMVEQEDKILMLNKKMDEQISEKESLEVVDFNHFVEMLKYEKSRQKINKFFKDNNFVFSFHYARKYRRVDMFVKKDGIEVVGITEKFNLHHPLKNFGIKNINDYSTQ